MDNLCDAGFEVCIRAVVKPKIRASNVALEDRHIADRIELGDFSALPAEYYYAAAPLGRE
jgi:hypothetical protein